MATPLILAEVVVSDILKSVEKIRPTWSKLPEDEERKLDRILERAKTEVPYEFEIEDTADTLMVRRKTESGEEIGMGFTKVGKKIPFSNGKSYHFSHVVEASMKYPGENISEAIEKLYKEKPELRSENEKEEK
jgi:hypothetical protein